jgi:hypothetical protein
LLIIVLGVIIMLGSALQWRLIFHPGKLLPRLVGVPAARIATFAIGMYLFIVGIARLIGADWFS